MSMLPTLFNGSVFDDMFSDPFFTQEPAAARSAFAQNAMSTDVKEKDGNYEVAIELPGFTKDNVSVEVKDGYLNVTARKEESKDEKGKDGKFLRRERYQGSRSRSFYVGKELKSDDVKARFADGVLTLTFPKEIKPAVEESQLVQIED
ncbi:MAG: Hsp20/alpha crystallin family protein [Bifidobacteriaceae bacterium]|nr:Hsp20/alpha crystallin family protein [Bifidobacteriaceae bacterium]MCI1979654.1 Hsp20/alpha crystallin family protein [Bifidobacteriaceae bacterium]